MTKEKLHAGFTKLKIETLEQIKEGMINQIIFEDIEDIGSDYTEARKKTFFIKYNGLGSKYKERRELAYKISNLSTDNLAEAVEYINIEDLLAVLAVEVDTAEENEKKLLLDLCFSIINDKKVELKGMAKDILERFIKKDITD